MDDLQNSWGSLQQLETEILLAHPETLPLSAGNQLLPMHIRNALHSSRFVKRSELPLLAYALFCNDDNGKPYFEDHKLAQRVLERSIGLSNASQDPLIGRVLVHCYFNYDRIFYDDLEYIYEDVQKLVFAHKDNDFLKLLFEGASSIKYAREGFSEFLIRFSGGYLDENSEYTNYLLSNTVPVYLKQMSQSAEVIQETEFLSEFSSFLFDSNLRIRDKSVAIDLLDAFFSWTRFWKRTLSISEKGILMDWAGLIQKDNQERLNSKTLNVLQETLTLLVQKNDFGEYLKNNCIVRFKGSGFEPVREVNRSVLFKNESGHAFYLIWKVDFSSEHSSSEDDRYAAVFDPSFDLTDISASHGVIDLRPYHSVSFKLLSEFSFIEGASPDINGVMLTVRGSRNFDNIIQKYGSLIAKCD